MPTDRVGRPVAKPQTRLRAIKVAARKVVQADERYAVLLGSGTDHEVHLAQREVWDAISELRRVLKRYAR